jgi:hypothetical protein
MINIFIKREIFVTRQITRFVILQDGYVRWPSRFDCFLNF